MGKDHESIMLSHPQHPVLLIMYWESLFRVQVEGVDQEINDLDRRIGTCLLAA
jgi:hypothetical protein